MGVLVPGSVHEGPSARPPINMSGNFAAHVSEESPSNISRNFSVLVSKVSEFSKLQKTNKKKTLKKAPRGARGGPQYFLGVIIYFFAWYKHPVKFQKSCLTHSLI